MSHETQFNFTVQELPDGEALTAEEVEQRLRKDLDDAGGMSIEALWSLACLYSDTGRIDEAATCIEQVIGLSGEDLEKRGSCMLALGQLEERRGDYTAAATSYRRALALEPCSPRTWYFIHNNLGFSLNQLGQHDSAIPYLEKAVDIDPGRPNAYKNLGLAYEALGEPAEAAEWFIAATQANASDSRALDHLLALLEANPALEVDVPGLRNRVEACQKAVEVARAQQPDYEAHWARVRDQQRP